MFSGPTSAGEREVWFHNSVPVGFLSVHLKKRKKTIKFSQEHSLCAEGNPKRCLHPPDQTSSTVQRAPQAWSSHLSQYKDKTSDKGALPYHLRREPIKTLKKKCIDYVTVGERLLQKKRIASATNLFDKPNCHVRVFFDDCIVLQK